MIRLRTCTSPRPLLLPLSYYLQCFPCCQLIHQYLPTQMIFQGRKTFKRVATGNSMDIQLHRLQGYFDWLPTPQQVCWLVPELAFELQHQSKQVSVSHSSATIHSMLLQLTDRTNVSWHLCLVSIIEGLSFWNARACVMLIQKEKHGKQTLMVITYSWYPTFDTVHCTVILQWKSNSCGFW